MQTLYLAEKPAAGKTLAQYLARKMGLAPKPMKDHILIGRDVAVCWLQGHILENVEPHAYDPRYKSWVIEDLPIIPQPFRLEPKERTRHLLSVVRELSSKVAEIVNCADPDDQGELLSMEVLRYLKVKVPIKRLWCSDLTDKGFDRAFANLKDARDYDGNYQSALSQSHADWLYGINMTRACTLEARRRGADLLLNIGRVKTPTWAMVVARELAIRNFKPQDFHIPWIMPGTKPPFRARWNPAKDDARLDPEGRLLDASAAEAIVSAAKAARHAVVRQAKTTAASESAPLPFSLSSLQAYASKVYGFGVQMTLDIAQALYEKKLVSYPRTAVEYIPESQHGDAPAILASLAMAPLPTSFVVALRGAKPQLKSRAFDTAKVDAGAHHAMVPTELANPADVQALPEPEKKIYLEIVRRYVLQFWPVAKLAVTEIDLLCGSEPFMARGKRYLDEGWRRAFAAEPEEREDGEAEDEDKQTLPDVREGMTLPLADVGIEQRTTTAPKRYTEGTLLTAMARAHLEVKDPKIRERLREKDGIGTEATRANIIRETVESDLFSLGGKNKREIIPSEDAIRFIGLLPDTMTKPDLTAMWQLYFDAIKAGKSTYEDFIRQQTAWLRKMLGSVGTYFEHVKFDALPARLGAKGRSQSSGRASVQLTQVPCLACESPLKRIKGSYGMFWSCTDESCKKTYDDKDGSPVEKAARAPVKDSGLSCPVCTKGTLRLVPRRDNSGSFWGCSAFRDGCRAGFNDVDGKPDFDKKPRAAVAESNISCPKCESGRLRLVPRRDNSGSFWGCSAYRDGCRAAYNDNDGVPDIGERDSRGAGDSGASSGGASARREPVGAPARQASRVSPTKPLREGGSFAERARRHGGSVAYDPLAGDQR